MSIMIILCLVAVLVIYSAAFFAVRVGAEKVTDTLLVCGDALQAGMLVCAVMMLADRWASTIWSMWQ